MKHLIIAALLAGSFVGSLAQEVEARMDVKGMSLGATVAEMKAVSNLVCRSDRSLEFDVVCQYLKPGDQTFAGQRATEIRFGVFKDELDSAQMLFPGAAYGALKIALDEKFGEVTPRGPSALSTYMMNGDRAHLMYLDEYKALLLFQSASGTSERKLRSTSMKTKVRKDM